MSHRSRIAEASDLWTVRQSRRKPRSRLVRATARQVTVVVVLAALAFSVYNTFGPYGVQRLLRMALEFGDAFVHLLRAILYAIFRSIPVF